MSLDNFTHGSALEQRTSGFCISSTFFTFEICFLFPYFMLDVAGTTDGEVPLRVYMQFKPDEITAIMKDFDEPGSLAPTGLHLGGTKYMVIQGESGAVIRGKKVF
jgi:hypothetical protein